MQPLLRHGQFFGVRDAQREVAGFSLSIASADPERPVARHSHEDAHFILLLDGHYLSTARGAGHLHADPALIYNPPGTTHRDTFPECEGRFLGISVAGSRFAEAAEVVTPSPDALRLWTPAALEAAQRIAYALDAASDFGLEAACLELVGAFGRDRESVHRPPRWLARARDALHDRACERLAMTALARDAGVHAVYLARAFRRFFGCTPALLVLIGMACGGGAARTTLDGFAGIAPAIERGDAPKTTSVLVMRGDAIVYEHYFNGATAATLHDTRSATKSLTALSVGIAIDRHVLPGLEAPAFAYLADPGAAGTGKEAITIEDLLTMSSALDCDDNDDKSPGNEENMYPQKSWLAWALAIPVRADYQRDPTGRGPWHYCTAGTFLLGQILQRAAKQPVDQFMAANLFAPLGITKWELARSPTDEVMTGGGLRLSTRDLATLAKLVRAGGKVGDKQVVSSAFVHAATTVHRQAFPDQEYGYLFWHRMYKTSCGNQEGWFMSGNGGNAVIVLPALDAIIVITRTAYNSRGMHQQTVKLIEDQILPTLACAK